MSNHVEINAAHFYSGLRGAVNFIEKQAFDTDYLSYVVVSHDASKDRILIESINHSELYRKYCPASLGAALDFPEMPKKLDQPESRIRPYFYISLDFAKNLLKITPKKISEAWLVSFEFEQAGERLDMPVYSAIVRNNGEICGSYSFTLFPYTDVDGNVMSKFKHVKERSQIICKDSMLKWLKSLDSNMFYIKANPEQNIFSFEEWQSEEKREKSSVQVISMAMIEKN